MRGMAPQGPSVLRGSTHPRWFGPVGAVLAVVAVMGGFAGFDAVRNEPMKTTQAAAGFGTLAVGLLAAIGLGFATKRELVVDGEGIEERRAGSKSVRIEWREDHDFYYRGITGSGIPSVEKVSVRTADGRRIDVDSVNVPGNPNAGVPKVVEQYSTAANWPRIQAKLQEGEEVAFGAIKMTREQLHIGVLKHSLAKRVTLQIDLGKIKIGTEGKWLTSEVWVRDVANYPCLLKAIGQVAQALPPG
jgi:hypothetical protein